MRIILMFIVFWLISTIAFTQNTNETIVYLIRHAEKVKDGSKDPQLTDKGNERAIYWAEVFKNTKFDAIYSTQTSRTIATAKPTADALSLEIIIYDAKTIDIIELVKSNPGKKILIVGHSNSTPNLVNTLMDENLYQEIEHTNNSNLYIVTYTPTSVSQDLLVIELP